MGAADAANLPHVEAPLKKKLLLAGSVVVALGVIGLIVASFFLGGIVRDAVNGYGPKLTGTRVSLGAASVSPLTGSGSLRRLVIGNPRGWSDADLLSLRRAHISVAPASIFGSHIVINDIDLDGPVFDYETRLVSSNVGDLLSTLDRAKGSSSAAAKARNGKPLRIEVRRFRMRDGVVRLGAGKAAVRIPLPAIELKDIGTKTGGVTAPELAADLMRSLADDIVRAATAAARKGEVVPKAANNALQNAKKEMKGLLGGRK